MINILLIMEIFSFIINDIEINHDYLDSQINISVSNFIDEYEYYQEKHYFNGETSEEIANKLNISLKKVKKLKMMFSDPISIYSSVEPK